MRHVADVKLWARLRTQKRSDKGTDAGHVGDIASGASWTPLKITRPLRSSKVRKATSETSQSGLEISAALCAGARRLRLLSVTGFLSASVLGWQSSRLPTARTGIAEVSRRARGAQPCPRQERTSVERSGAGLAAWVRPAARRTRAQFHLGRGRRRQSHNGRP